MHLKQLQHQVVVVIGSSSGIGRAAALGFAAKGSKVLVAARSRPGILSLVQEIHKIQSHTPSAASTESHGLSSAEEELSEKEGVVAGTESPIIKEFDKVVGMYCDVSNTTNLEEVALKAISKWGRVDSWVHVAGITQFARFTDTTEEEMRRIIDVNFVGACRSAWTIIPKLKQQPGNSTLMFVSSVEARRALPYQSAYSASKHAMDGMVEALRTELMEDAPNINVVSILPSNIDTPFYDKGRQKMPGHFKYVGCPPTYTPEQVAKSIMFGVCNNTREIVVGDGGYGLTWLQAFVPSAIDWVFSKFGDQLERTIYRKDPNEKDNLFTTADPRYDTVRGHWGSRPVPFSLYNAIVENNALKAFVVLSFGILLAFFMYKLLV